MAYFFGSTKSHAHTSTPGDGGGLAAGSTLLGNSLASKILSYRRPTMIYTGFTTIIMENNTANANETAVLFPDNDYRAITSSLRTADIAVTASQTGTKSSGIRTSESRFTNNWYYVYACKATDNTTDFVVIYTQVAPVQANVSTLNSNFGGANNWVYLGLIRHGDNILSSNIVKFTQTGNMIFFYSTTTANAGGTVAGIQMTGSPSTVTLTLSYSAGVGASAFPSIITMCLFTIAMNPTTATSANISDTSGNRIARIAVGTGNSFYCQIWARPNADIILASNNAEANAKDIFLTAFVDGILGEGSTLLI